MIVLNLLKKMRWNKKILKRKIYKESISREQLRKCLFRFLKEFGFFHKYLSEIKCHLVSAYYDDLSDGIKYMPISYDVFLKRQIFALRRNMFPAGNIWDEIYYLWVSWAKDEDAINEKTLIL